MNNSGNVQNFENEVNNIIDSIKIVEEQIKGFEETKPFFFRKYKLKKYGQRINELESIKKYLFERLEYKIDKNKNYH